MVWEKTADWTLLDSSNLKPIRHFDQTPAGHSFTRNGFLRDDVLWLGQYPKDEAFVTLTNETGEHLLFHGDCGGDSNFLTDDKILLTGCDTLRIIDISGELLGETIVEEGNPTFAGVSQDGRRFAVEFNESGGDPPSLLYDLFEIFDTETLKPVAIIRLTDLPEGYAWSAFSPDGTLFAAGTPTSLGLYRIP